MKEGTAFLGECATGASFDTKVKYCLPEEIVDCSHITTTPKSPKTESEWDYLCKGVKEGSLVGHPYDCKKV